MVCIVNPNNYPTKKSLKEAVEKGETITIEDPSLFNPRIFTTKDLKEGETIVVTNHPKRSYFCQIIKRVDGKVVMK